MLGFNPVILVMVAGLLSGPAVYGVMKVQELRKWRVAYDQGVEAGKALSANSTVASAGKTAQAERDAEAATAPTAGRAARIELCKRDPSCRRRAEAQAGAIK